MASDCLKIWVQQQGWRREFGSTYSTAKRAQVHPQCCKKGAGASTVLQKGAGPSTVLQRGAGPSTVLQKGAGPSTVLQEGSRFIHSEGH